MKGFINKIISESIENLQICYIDYSGRLCGKIVPQHKFESVFTNGIVFSR